MTSPNLGLSSQGNQQTMPQQSSDDDGISEPPASSGPDVKHAQCGTNSSSMPCHPKSLLLLPLPNLYSPLPPVLSLHHLWIAQCQRYIQHVIYDRLRM